MSRTFDGDYKVGVKSEEMNLTALKQLDASLERVKDKFAPFDYANQGNNILVELKTRTNKKDAYPTTMIPLTKVRIAERNPEKTYYFAFCFLDGLYYIKYEKTLFDTFEVKEGGRFDRGRPELNQYVYIPVELLSSFELPASTFC